MSDLVGVAPGFASPPWAGPFDPRETPRWTFPLIDLMDQDACYHKLVALLHPGGLACPACKASDHLRVHRRHRAR